MKSENSVQNWYEIKNNEDIKNLLNIFGGFHDACVKEVHFYTGTHVNPDLSMAMGVSSARFIFERQYVDPSVIEVEFNDLIVINLKPTNKEFFPVIFGASAFLVDGIIYWAEIEDWNINDENKNDVTWVAAGNARWRIRDDLLGKSEILD